MAEMKLVPVVPTEAMLDAARGLIMSLSFGLPNYKTPLIEVAKSGFYGEHWAHVLTDEERHMNGPITKGHRAQLIYRAMLAASPQAPAREGVEPYPGETADLIDQIRQSEGNAVTIMCDNPDFNGQSNSAVEVVADWTNWQTVRFTGDNVIDALRAARDRVGGKIMGDCDSLTRIQIERAITPREEAPAEGVGDAWPVITDDWINTYCELTGRDPDGGSVTFLGDGPVSSTFKDTARREIDAMLCAAPKSVFRARTSEPEAGSSIDDLVDRFATALRGKLHAAEAKYGHDDAWMRDDWQADLVRDLQIHVEKGDPRDVAAYCAFAWHHGWSTRATEGAGEWSIDDLETLISDALDDSLDMDWNSRDGAKAVMRALKNEGVLSEKQTVSTALVAVRNITHPESGYSSDDAARKAAFKASDSALSGLTPTEQKAQAARCSCRGADDMCPCQNSPDSQTIKDRSDA